MASVGRLVFRGLVPALLLPAIAAVAAVAAVTRELGSIPSAQVTALSIVAYLVVLLASMSFNAVLLLRNPSSLTTGTLPNRVAWAQLAQWALILAWSIALVAGRLGVEVVVFGGVIAAASVVVCVLAAARRRMPVAPVAEFDLPRGVRVILLAYLALGAATLVLGLAAAVTNSGGLLAAAAVAVLLLGLPWSPGLMLLLFALQFSLLGDGVLLYLSAAAVVANIVIAAVLLWSPRRRARFVTWFFRLREAEKPVDEGVSRA